MPAEVLWRRFRGGAAPGPCLDNSGILAGHGTQGGASADPGAQAGARPGGGRQIADVQWRPCNINYPFELIVGPLEDPFTSFIRLVLAT